MASNNIQRNVSLFKWYVNSQRSTSETLSSIKGITINPNTDTIKDGSDNDSKPTFVENRAEDVSIEVRARDPRELDLLLNEAGDVNVVSAAATGSSYTEWFSGGRWARNHSGPRDWDELVMFSLTGTGFARTVS